MADFLAAYSIQNWLESCPQGYLHEVRAPAGRSGVRRVVDHAEPEVAGRLAALAGFLARQQDDLVAAVGPADPGARPVGSRDTEM